MAIEYTELSEQDRRIRVKDRLATLEREHLNYELSGVGGEGNPVRVEEIEAAITRLRDEHADVLEPRPTPEPAPEPEQVPTSAPPERVT